MKVSELSGAMLDYWVARAEGRNPAPVKVGERLVYAMDQGKGFEVRRYSTDWAQGGAIIERERIKLLPTIPTAATWHASIWIGSTLADGVSHRAQAEAPLVAAMRAYVVSKFGDEVSDECAASQPHVSKGEEGNG